MPESTSPMDEAARLNALSGLHLLDTPPEERFDRLTRLAQHLLRVPIALISLIDTDRVWFKSAQGLALKQVSLDVSFCTHAHANQGLFEVADARNDPRFAGNPLVTGDPHIRFYASCPIVAPDGTPIGVLCVADRTPSGLTDGDRQALRDLTEMVNQELRLGSIKQAAAAQQRSEARLASVIEHLPVGFLSMDATGRIECVNRKAETLFGLSAGTTGDVTLGSLLIQPADAPADVLQHLLRTSFEVPSPWEGRRTDGSHFPCDVTIYTLPGDNGATHAIHVRDMSEHREVDRLRREFLSTVSHRLRTPLSAIRGSLGLLAKGVVGQLPAPAHEMLVIAERNSVRMASLINDILDLEFLESGQMVLRWTNQSLNDALNLLPAALKASLTARRITLDVFGGEIRLAADADRLAQLLEKLLTNAANFSPAGSTVAIAVAAADGWVNVEIHDRGPGIAPEHRQIVFERFWQADTLDSSQRGGAGLGLTIARAIVALHGGTIGVGSNVTEGTTLWFRLPANAKLDTGPLSLA